jgi:GTP cyclohydrolase I
MTNTKGKELMAEGIKEYETVSEIIRKRISDAKANFTSTDNISGFIHPGEMESLIDEVADKMSGVLSSLVIDTENDHNTRDTARRIAKMYINETFSGRYLPAPPVTSFPNAKTYDQLMVTGPITIRSVCAHHFQNITGVAYIGVFPGDKVIGLSKYNRIISWLASRPTIQEELTVQIADEIERITEARGVAVLIKASHGCMTARGVLEHENDFTTSVVRGSLRDIQSQKDEFFRIVSGMKGWGAN